MTRYLDESDVMMVEEGFTTRDLLEITFPCHAHQATREAFFVANLEDVMKKHMRLLKALPRVKPVYPLKCNSSQGVVQMLAGLGAGFSCTNKTAAVINSALDLYFPEGCGVEILAELGRYYVHSAFTLVVNIIAKKEVPLDQLGSDEEDAKGKRSFVYHINDGVYGSLGSVIFSNTCPVPILPKVRRDASSTPTMGIGGRLCSPRCVCLSLSVSLPPPSLPLPVALVGIK
uniref:Antizyme inhibitor 2 n=1 Tax=Pseudonaja textilis TaxID=8673 RepID=A0A670XV71_PSETE